MCLAWKLLQRVDPQMRNWPDDPPPALELDRGDVAVLAFLAGLFAGVFVW